MIVADEIDIVEEAGLTQENPEHPFEQMNEDEFCDIVEKATQAARAYAENELSDDRRLANEYYEGRVTDLALTMNRSTMVSNDLRAVVSKIQPAIMRTFFNSTAVVAFQAAVEEEADHVKQISDAINRAFVRNGGYSSLEDCTQDALISDEGIIRYSIDGGKLTFDAIPPERLLISKDARNSQDAALIGHWSMTTRSELLALGYDLNKVMEADEAEEVQSLEDFQRMVGGENADDDLGEQTEEIEIYEIFARIDYNGDGIAELRRIVFMNKCEPENILVNEECARARIFVVRCESRPHSWRGRALARDVMDIQRAKTALLRAAMDNLSAVNDPTTFVDTSGIDDVDDLLQRKRGAIILANGKDDIRKAVTFIQVPMTANHCFEAMKYYDQMLIDRTGVSGAAAGMLPEVLQGQTATATNLIEQGGTARTELICRNFAEGALRPMFEAVFFDICDMHGVTFQLEDVNVNVGLGSGTKERDMAALLQIMGIQKDFLTLMGEDNPFVTPENISNTLDKVVEVSGLRTPETYFTRPTPEALQQRAQAKASQPSPEQMKIDAQMQLEEKKAIYARDKESAQAEADTITKQQDEAAKAQERADKLMLEREKLASHEKIEFAKLASSERAALRASGQEEEKIDPETGEKQPSQMEMLIHMMGGIAEQMARTQALIAAPKMTKIVRDENGRAAGTVQEIDNGMVQ